MNGRQERFVAEYMKDLNATEAAKRAGYSPKTAYSIGGRLLKHVEIAAAIRAAMDAASLTDKRIWEEWRRIGLADIGDIMDFSGPDPRLRPANEISEDARRAIASVKVKRYVEGKGDDAKVVEVTEFKLWDKTKVLADAAKSREMFTERVEMSGRGGNPFFDLALLAKIATKSMPDTISERIKAESTNGELGHTNGTNGKH